MSVLPPGAQGMMIRIGFAGHCWAKAEKGMSDVAMRAKTLSVCSVPGMWLPYISKLSRR
jgi:hypothetical protein